MKKMILILFSVLAFSAYACAADQVKKVVKDVEQTASDVNKAGKAAVEKGKEVITQAAAATTKTAAAVENQTQKTGNKLMDKFREFGRAIKRLFSK